MKPDGGPAFPMADQYTQNGDPVYQGSCGMTLRDYFAAAALKAMLSLHPTYQTGPDRNSAARRSYEIADAMLAERAK